MNTHFFRAIGCHNQEQQTYYGSKLIFHIKSSLQMQTCLPIYVCHWMHLKIKIMHTWNSWLQIAQMWYRISSIGPYGFVNKIHCAMKPYSPQASRHNQITYSCVHEHLLLSHIFFLTNDIFQIKRVREWVKPHNRLAENKTRSAPCD